LSANHVGLDLLKMGLWVIVNIQNRKQQTKLETAAIHISLLDLKLCGKYKYGNI
jgi:hypothetical protein